MKNLKLSIIIPTFNEEERLDNLLAYLKKNSGTTNPEILIADGGSSDGTLSIAENHEVKIVCCARKSRAAQMNEGADKATGSILYFLHADTIPPKNFTEHITRTFRDGYPSGCFRLMFDDLHPVLKLYSWFTRFPFTFFRFGDQSLYVQKYLFRKLGGFDETLMVMEDQQIVSRLKREGPFRVMKESVTTSARRYLKNGVYRLQGVFALIVGMYYLGASQDTLVHVYQSFVKQSDYHNK